jgi:hypothetical protein
MDVFRGLSLRAKYTDRATAKLVSTCVVSVTDLHGRILGFLDRSLYYFFQVAPPLCSRGWVDPVPDPLLLRKSGSDENRSRDLWICSPELWPVDHTTSLKPQNGDSNKGRNVKQKPNSTEEESIKKIASCKIVICFKCVPLLTICAQAAGHISLAE